MAMNIAKKALRRQIRVKLSHLLLIRPQVPAVSYLAAFSSLHPFPFLAEL
jgi:hypothetical protein